MSTFDEINRKKDDGEWANALIDHINDLADSFDESDQSDPAKTDLRHRLSNLRHRLRAFRDGAADSTKSRAQLEAIARDTITRYSKVKKPVPTPPAPTLPTKNQKVPTSPLTPPAPKDDTPPAWFAGFFDALPKENGKIVPVASKASVDDHERRITALEKNAGKTEDGDGNVTFVNTESSLNRKAGMVAAGVTFLVVLIIALVITGMVVWPSVIIAAFFAVAGGVAAALFVPERSTVSRQHNHQ